MKKNEKRNERIEYMERYGMARNGMEWKNRVEPAVLTVAKKRAIVFSIFGCLLL